MIVRVLILIVGVFACSTAVVLIKSCDTHPVLLAAWRLIIGASILTPLYWRDRARYRDHYTRRQHLGALLPGTFFAIHLVSWAAGARLTPAAHASLIVNMVPVVMPFLMVLLVREVVTRMELVGTAVAMVGLVLLTAGDFSLNRAFFAGDLVCFGSMLMFATYLAFGRRNRHVPSLWLYVVPLYWVAGILCLVLAFVVSRYVLTPGGRSCRLSGWAWCPP